MKDSYRLPVEDDYQKYNKCYTIRKISLFTNNIS